MKVVFLVGPTASGKSDLGLNLAEQFGGAILNADSVQIYQRLVIGSAAPSKEDKARVPHLLFQTVPPPERLTAGDYSRLAREALAECRERYPVVFVVGGTGFYLLALENGMLPIEKADEKIQASIEGELAQDGGAARLHAELAEKDPIVGARISVNDHYRLVRALETLRRTGRRLSEIEAEYKASKPDFPYPLLKLGVSVDREELRGRIEKRTRRMVETGLLQETQDLIDEGFGDWDPLQSVGYKEAGQYLRGDQELPDREALEARIVQNTMRLAKRQRTWFQRDQQIHWGETGEVSFFASRVRDFLGG